MSLEDKVACLRTNCGKEIKARNLVEYLCFKAVKEDYSDSSFPIHQIKILPAAKSK